MEESKLSSNKKVVENFFKVINERQLEKLIEFMSRDVVDHNKIIHGEEDKPGAAFDGIRQQLAAFHPLQFQIEELIAENSSVVARITQSGSHTGPHPRMPLPTNRSFENEAIFIFTIKNDKISEIRAVSDRLGLFLQLGWDWPEAD
ncbi:ester cyclase [Fictibacillus gelatini]|uniref:ester cyclase n=1 Tax=Fictibacillus gelatini TaxID=225985 RepID=UPI000410B8EA|nr:ester cyclase [Fictibacillus gelatini]